MIVVVTVKKPPETPPRPSWHMEGSLWLPDYETTEGGIVVPWQIGKALWEDKQSAILRSVLQWDFSTTKVIFNPICFIGAGMPSVKPGRIKPMCSCGCTGFFRRCLRRGFTDGQCKKCGRRRPIFDKKQKQWRQA